jgi:hypothetical protein
MDKNTITLIGTTEVLRHILETDPVARTSRNARTAGKRLESIREELLAEGLRHSKLISAARDSIFDLSAQLQGHLTGHRDMQSTLHALQSINNEDGTPPPPPSSSSSGPGGFSPEIIQLARKLVEAASARAENESRPVEINRVAPLVTANGHAPWPARSPARNKRA